MTVLSTTYPTTSAAHDKCPWCGTLISRARFLEIQTKIRDEEKKKLVEMEANMRKQLQIEAATIRKQAQEETERKFKPLIEQVDQQRQKELIEQRLLLQKDKDQALLKERGGFARVRESYQKKLNEMQRQLDNKTANELGDGAEIDLLELLRETFLDDRITRIKKGEPGADILHEVLYKGETCGRIITDSKSRQSWQTSYVKKLRQDQLDAEAEYAVLSTTI